MTSGVRLLSDGAATRPEDEADARVWDLAATVCDPEIPVLSIADLGMLRTARAFTTAAGARAARVEITPTYSGCPAMDTLVTDVTAVLKDGGYDDVAVSIVLSPAWTTDWMTQAGKDALEAYGIAPPTGSARAPREPGSPVPLTLSVRCPRCGSLDTAQVARFASTSCKALYTCSSCLEPFDYFKVL